MAAGVRVSSLPAGSVPATVYVVEGGVSRRVTIGSAALAAIGTSGATVPLCNTSITWTGDQTFSGRILGGFGAFSTAGVLDWNHATNSTPGSGAALMNSSSASNAPPEVNTSSLFHPFTFEYQSKDGSGQLTQLAIPYSNNIANDAFFSGLWIRGRYLNTWTSWRRIPLCGTDGSLHVSGTLGYTPGGGGAVTQLTSKATAVTLNNPRGNITMNAASLAANTAVVFTLNNSTIGAGDRIILNHTSGGTFGAYVYGGRCAAGSAQIYLRNVTAGALAEAVVLGFTIIKG